MLAEHLDVRRLFEACLLPLRVLWIFKFGVIESGPKGLRIGGPSNVEIPAQLQKLGPLQLRLGLDHLRGLWGSGSADDRDVGLDDPGLFPCDFGKGVPQLELVVVADARDDAKRRRADVGAV